MNRWRRPPLQHPLAPAFARAVESLCTALTASSTRNYNMVVRNFLVYLGTKHPEVTRLKQLRRDPHILGWMARLRAQTPLLAATTCIGRLFALRTIFYTSHDSDTTISGVTEPVIGQQSVEEMIRLKEGESNILGGLLREQNNLTVSGTPGLGEVPLLKYLFSTQQRVVEHEEIVFLITPHLVRGVEVDPLNLRQIDTGTAGAIQLRLVQSTPREATSPPQ